MSYIGKTPTAVPLTSSDIPDSTISQADLVDQAVNEAKMQVSNSPTNGYFLSAQSGNTGGMTWAEAGGGDFVKIATVTASGSSNVVSFDGHFSSTYDKYRIYIQNWRGNDNSNLTMRYRIGNTEKSSGHYAHVQEGLYRNTSGIGNDNNSGWDNSAIRITPNGADDSATYFQHCVVDLINPLGTGSKTCTFETSLNAFDQTLFIHGIGGGHYFGDTGALSGLSFYISAGNITATIKIYGIKT